MVKDYYRILGLTSQATAEEIKKNFRSLAKQYHPDANGSAQENDGPFKEINEAYQVLGDEQKRRHYDLICHQVLNDRETNHGNFDLDLAELLRFFANQGSMNRGPGFGQGRGFGRGGCRRKNWRKF